MINLKFVGFILGVLLIIEGVFMLTAVPFSFFYGDGDASFIYLSTFFTLLSGFILWVSFRSCSKNIGKREGFIIVSFGWIAFSLFGALPFYISGGIPSYTDAFFETMSGFTTTGASILNNIESLSHGLLYWRSITQWLGGMGIILLSLLVFPALGIGSMHIFTAEVSGSTPEKLHPRIKETAKRLWAVYCIITLIEVLLLWLGGLSKMSLFDAICHSFTTISTGGFSTKQASIAFYGSRYIEYIVTLFMIIAGVNFSLSYFAMNRKFKPVWKNEEFRSYLSFIAVFTIVITLILIFTTSGESIEKLFRNALFQVTSIISTTGFATVDYLKWMPVAWMLLLVLMFFGSSAGSTGGGIKIIRIILLFKNVYLELKRLIHPNAIIPVRIDKEAVNDNVVTNVISFVSVYVLITIVSMIVVSFMGHDLRTSLGSVVATLGNIGPGLGAVGPTENFAHFSIFGKWFLSFLMLIGRLELFTFLVLLAPAFWRR